MAEPSYEQALPGGLKDPARRALLATLIALGGGILVIACVPPLGNAIGLRTDLAYNVLGNLIWLAIAAFGAMLLHHRLRFGQAGPWLMTLPVGILAFAIAIGLAAFLGRAAMLPTPPIMPLAFVAGTAGVALGAVAEEALFRGFLQPLLQQAWGATAAVLVGAAGFTLVHVVGGWSAPITLVNILLAGIWFGLIALRAGGFGAAFLAHAGWNWAEALLFGAAPNPGLDPAGSVIDIDLGGPAWLGGSGDGMNSALPTTIVLAMLIVPLLLMRGREGEAPAVGLPRAALPELRP